MNGTLIVPNSVEDIKKAVDMGLDVFHHNSAYRVIKDNLGQYLIIHTNGSAIGLTWRDGVTLNGKLDEFIIVTLQEAPEDTLTEEEMKLLKQCDGKHGTLDEIFGCASCSILFKEGK